MLGSNHGASLITSSPESICSSGTPAERAMLRRSATSCFQTSKVRRTFGRPVSSASSQSARPALPLLSKPFCEPGAACRSTNTLSPSSTAQCSTCCSARSICACPTHGSPGCTSTSQ